MNTFCCKCFKEMALNESCYGLHKCCFKDWFSLKEDDQFMDLVIRSQSQVPAENYVANISFFNGAYRKYSARLGESSYILKVQQNEYPELPATEFLCNQIYESLNIMIPNYYLMRFPEDQLCFVTKNFMSDLIASDLVHIYHFVKNDKNHDCESLIDIIGEQTGRRIEQERFVYLTLADSLIGNHDRHGRNLGFIRSSKGMRLAPFYDNPTAIALEEPAMLAADLQPRGSIFTKASDKPTMKDYVHEWNRLGYGDIVDRFRKQYTLAPVRALVEKSFISAKRQKAILKLISKRGEELCAS